MQVVQVPLDQLIQIVKGDGFSIADMISIVVSIVLGVMSISLGIFAMRLSGRFENKAIESLQKVNDISLQIKVLVDTGIIKQSDMSGKMLDTIITHGNYWSNKEDVLNKNQFELLIKDYQSNMLEMVEKSLAKFEPGSLSSNIEELKRQVISITEKMSTEIKENKTIVSDDTLFRKLEGYKIMPAFYVLLYAISDGIVTSIDKLNELRYKYSIPKGFDAGVEKLLENGILKGSINDFTINTDYADDLKKFISANKKVIVALIKSYKEVNAADEYNVPDENKLKAVEQLQF